MKETVLVIVLGTATPGGGFPVYGAAFAETVSAQEPALRVEPRNTKGSAENVPLLEAGKLDIALVAGDYASGALAKRSAGAFSRHLRMPDSQRRSRSFTWTRGDGGASRSRLMAIAIAVSPVNGTTPVTIS